MRQFFERMGGIRRYVPALIVMVFGGLFMYWPGGVGTDDPREPMLMLGATFAVGAVAWMIYTLDRQVSNDPRYQRPVYTEDDDPED